MTAPSKDVYDLNEIEIGLEIDQAQLQKSKNRTQKLANLLKEVAIEQNKFE